MRYLFKILDFRAKINPDEIDLLALGKLEIRFLDYKEGIIELLENGQLPRENLLSTR